MHDPGRLAAVINGSSFSNRDALCDAHIDDADPLPSSETVPILKLLRSRACSF